MPELLRLKTTDWELTVWCSDLSSRQLMLFKMLQRHGKEISDIKSRVCFSSSIKCELTDVFSSVQNKVPLVIQHFDSTNEITLNNPLFFENIQYQFEWVFFNPAIIDASVQHKLASINEAFRFANPRYEHELPRLLGVVNTANDIGWLKLPLYYQHSNGIKTNLAISLEILPVKMDMHSDLPAMYKIIDANYPLWRFSLAQKTEQSVSRSLKLGYFPLLWLAHFEHLHKRMMNGLKVISQSPHSRLQAVEKYIKADRLKGKMPTKLIESVSQNLKQGLYDKRYCQSKKKLSIDTPENRFIKMVVKTTKLRLADFHHKLVISNKSPENQRLSDSFIEKIYSWQTPLLQMQKQNFLKEVGPFKNLNSESLVLQQKTGYIAVYRVWQELKFYLDMFANQSSVSMKSVSEIYEVWCFLELRRILVDDLGFSNKTHKKAILTLREFEYKLKDGFGGAFEFERSDGIGIRLAHEPVFTNRSKKIRTYGVAQSPDILMEVTFPDKKKCIWLFDAKYRIQLDQNDTESAIDYVPEDALNQMHRYRDALIRIENESIGNTIHKSRPVFGAFALYPGFFNQDVDENPYETVIDEIGIGAFALLPSEVGSSGHRWLADYLVTQIGKLNGSYAFTSEQMSEKLYLQEAARIPFYGMKQVLYPDLVMTTALDFSKIKTTEYINSFQTGDAQWCHIPASAFSEKYASHVLHEICYLAIATASEGSHTRSIKHLWRVKNVQLKERKFITEIQAGNASTSTELYWLFEMYTSKQLITPIEGVPANDYHHSMKFTNLDALNSTAVFSELSTVYTNMLMPV